MSSLCAAKNEKMKLTRSVLMFFFFSFRKTSINIFYQDTDRSTTMFKGLVVLLVTSDTFTAEDAKETERQLLSQHVSKVYFKNQSDTDVNYLDKDLDQPINHIVSDTVEFIEYHAAQLLMIPVTTASWISHSIEQNKILNLKSYNPDPKNFLKDCFVCIADNLPAGDKEVIYGGVRAFGGQYMDDLTKHTTHLIALDLTNVKSIIASSANQLSNSDDSIDIKIVLPHWINDCLKQGKKLSEEPYLLSNPKVHQEKKPMYSLIPESDQNNKLINDDSLPNIEGKTTDFFKDKTFYFSSDYNLSERMSNCFSQLVESNGGHTVSTFNVKDIDIYIGKYRSGDEYKKCCLSNRIVVANLQWMYHVLLTNTWILPQNSNLLHYPFPKDPLDEFKNKKISVTNYSGDARFYLTKLITLLGGDFTKTLTRENDFLIVAKPDGKKYESAKNKWKNIDNKPIVEVANHLWLEECYSSWSYIDSNLPRFQYFGSKASGRAGTESLLGKTKLNHLALQKWYLDPSIGSIKLNSEGTNVDDSMSEDESPTLTRNTISQKQTDTERENDQEIQPDVQEEDQELVDFNDEEDEGEPEKTESIEKSQHDSNESQSKSQASKLPTPATPEIDLDKSVEIEDQAHISNLESSDQAATPSISDAFSGRVGRSAKQKAALKLHSDMEDLNAYKVLSKSSRKMKSYMKELEAREEAIKGSSRKRPASESAESSQVSSKEDVINGSTSPLTSQTSHPPVKKKKPSSPDRTQSVVAIMTGCELELVLNRVDVVKLSHSGIKIVNDYSPKHKINTIFAPRILRTEKFLKSLSQAERIIHPNYLVKALKKVNEQEITWDELSKEYNISDYALDKVIPLKEINQDLGIANTKTNGLSDLFNSENKGSLFKGMKLNLSTNLNGGVNLITSILQTHGLEEAKSFKSVPASVIKQLLKNDNGKVIFVAHKTKDSKLINSIKKNDDNIMIVEWDWCVKSIFRMKLEDLKDYRL